MHRTAAALIALALFAAPAFAEKLPLDSGLSIATYHNIFNNCSIVLATPPDTLGWKPADRACKTAVKSWKRYIKHPTTGHLRSLAEDGLELVAATSVLELGQEDWSTQSGDQNQLDQTPSNDFDRFTFRQ